MSNISYLGKISHLLASLESAYLLNERVQTIFGNIVSILRTLGGPSADLFVGDVILRDSMQMSNVTTSALKSSKSVHLKNYEILSY